MYTFKYYIVGFFGYIHVPLTRIKIKGADTMISLRSCTVLNLYVTTRHLFEFLQTNIHNIINYINIIYLS